MTFNYKALGLGKARRNPHPECGTTLLAIVGIAAIVLALSC